MSFTRKTWVTGDVISATELNRVEQGVVDSHATFPESIHVRFQTSAPEKIGGDASLTLAAWPGGGQFRINHTRGNQNFVVHVTKSFVVISGAEPDTNSFNASAPVVLKNSSYIDVWFVSDINLHTEPMEFMLTLFPYPPY